MYQKDSVDFFCYSGGIDAGLTFSLLPHLRLWKKHKSATLLLTTHGGDLGEAYRLARWFQRNYETFSVLVTGPCASAGTLIALGAKAIALSETGNLGPIEPQTLQRGDASNFTTIRLRRQIADGGC